MDLDELRAFLKVVDEGSLARAASTLLVSRTTIRRRIEALEARVGTPLFGHTASGVEPTEAGRLLAARGRLLLREAEHLAEALRDGTAEPSGVLRVAVPPGLPPFLLQPVVRLWRERYARLSIDITVREEPMRALLESADLAAVFGDVVASGPWTVLPVATLREWIVASDDYLARRGTPASIEELAGHELLVWRSPDGDPRLMPGTDRPWPVEPSVSSSDVHWLRKCAMAGMGLVCLPDARLPDPPGSIPLRPVLSDRVGRSFPFSVAFSRTRAGSPQMRAVLHDLVPSVERARTMLQALQGR
jgi:DNA-binding transcriptional LysR family regulator